MLLTIDIGTSSFKSAVWDYDGNRLSFASVPLSITKSGGEMHETDPAIWLRAFEECCKKFFNLPQVQAIIISGNGPSLVPVTGKPSIKNNRLCAPAGNARLWLDRRAVKYSDEVSDLMGGFVDSGFFLPKILSIKNDENDLYNKTRCFLGCPEYLAYALTGEARTVFPSQGFDRWFWTLNILEKLKLDKEKFPGFISPGDQFGEIIPQTAERFGFNKNIPVVSGGPDFFASIIGAGITKPSHACDRTGSSEGINLCTQKKINDKRLMSYGHPVKPYWNLSGIISTTGKAIEWCRDIFGISGYDDFFSLAKESPPGSGGLIFNPYLTGERAPVWDPSVRGLWRGISLSSGRSEFANSVLEGIGFAVKDVIAAMEESGAASDQLRVTGGLAGTETLNQIKADISGREILQPVHKEAELLGLAIIGACFKNRFSSYEEAISKMVRIEKHFEPNAKHAGLYDEMFREYRKFRHTVQV
ncbi:MAG: FGGY-family carbohydrate kinase [Treponema sp.]|nr:FGGY-family carbohydrate kinase [Treponema sp.]